MRRVMPFRLLAIAASITLAILLSATLTGVNGLAAWVNSQDGDSCVAALSGDGAITGQWADDCESENRTGSYARYYSFTLEVESEVTITLESEVDTWVYLLEGSGRSGGVRYDNDDIDSDNRDSQIKETLVAGSYTIEATTYRAGDTGTFTLTVSGLGPGEPPQVLIGTASVDGMPVPPGTSITAWDGDRQIGSAKAVEDGKYTLLVARSAGPIAFKIGSLDADQTYRNWMSGQITRGFDLTATDTCRQALSGDGATTGQWEVDCESENRTGSYARYYSFTLEMESEVTITLESEVDTWVYLLEGAGRSGAVRYNNDDIVSGNTDSQIKETLAAGSYTIEATTYNAGDTGSFTLTVSGIGTDAGQGPEPTPGDSCVAALSGNGATTGQWADDCESENRTSSYARYYSFTLDEEGEVTITLESEVDTWLYLLEGTGRTGAVRYNNDDIDSGNRDSQIKETLAAGSYTIEATTYDAGKTGSFTLTVSGLVTAPPAIASDRDALVAFYHATDGPNWRNSANWLTDAPIEEWHGVSTDSAGRVTGLDSSSNELSGELPPELGDLANLQELTLADNQLTGAIPAELGDLANLQELTLADNQLTGSIPPELGDLANLQELTLADNQLTGAIPAELGNLANLTVLTLADNQLAGAIPPELGDLANLEELTLAGNLLTGAIPAELGDLANLAILTLASNRLTGSIPAELGDLADLEELTLAGNLLTGCIPEGLRDVPDNDLTSLRLPFCGPAAGNSFALKATGGAGAVTLNWADQEGIDPWQVRWRAEDEFYGAWTEITGIDRSDTDLQATIPGLLNAVRFCFQVRESPGPRSNEACAITAAAPEQADDLAATAGIRQVTLTWDNPTDDTITEWQYRYTTADRVEIAWKNISGSNADTVSYTVENLDSGKEYTFYVRALAHDTPGDAADPESDDSNVVTLEPGPPVGLAAESGDEQVTLSWADPDDDGIYKWQYKYKVAAGEFGDWIDVVVAGEGDNAAAAGVVVDNLANDVEYTFQVRAVATANPAAPVGPDVPGPAASATHFLEAPTAATAVEGGIPNQTIALGQRRVLDLSFFFVDGKGVGAIDGYHVNVSPSDAPVFARISSAGLLTIIGLNEGVAVVVATAIDGYDSNGSGDAADDDPSLIFIVTVMGDP